MEIFTDLKLHNASTEYIITQSFHNVDISALISVYMFRFLIEIFKLFSGHDITKTSN